MTICIVIAGIISILSIFAFFGNAFSNTGGTAIPNMFQLMFGGTGVYQGVFIQWAQFGVLTFLFILEILIIIIAMISFFISYKVHEMDYSENVGIIVSVVSILMSLVALIISFCTLQITDVNDGGYYNVQLGFGPVFYSVLHIIVIIILVVGIIVGKKQSSYSLVSAYKKPSSSLSSSSYFKPVATEPSLSENEKAELILKYKKMLDGGIITQEEFEKKKKELL